MLVAAAANATDVRAAVLAARERDLPVSVYATGHGTLVANDGGVQIDTSAMAEVLVDPDRRTARVGPGYTLGGGMGWLGRRFGLASDSLLRADVVTADGELVRATADRNGDLFWALRGGGGNFGIVTSLELRLFDVPQVYA